MQFSLHSILCAVIIHLTIVFSVNSTKNENLLVEIGQGPLKGSVMQSSEQRRFLAFRGIPYAEPPIGSLRFNDPVPAKPWQGVLEATKEAPVCLQYDEMMRNFLGKEDCLFLNVYTKETSGGTLRPVLVWIHGGGWMQGSGNGQTYLYGPEYLMNEDIVLVTINYRLAMFGFLSTEDEEAPGNYGLLDQVLALNWVKENIEKFGGDSNSITIFGESAGGVAVHYMMITPHTRGLFHRAISQSGTTMCSWATTPNLREKAFKLGKALKCDTNNSKNMMNCLRSADGADIVRLYDLFKVFVGTFPIPFGPRVDRERPLPIVPDEPKSLLQQGKYHAVPWMTGVTKNEGALFVAMVKTNGALQKLIDQPEVYLQHFLNYDHLSSTPSRTTNAVLTRYFENSRITHDQLNNLVDATSDSLFNKGFVDALELHVEQNLHPIYVYQFSHRFKISISDFVGYTGPDMGVGHADDMLGLFRMPMMPFLGGNDKKVSKTMLLSNDFAYVRDPNGDVAAEDRIWFSVSERSGYLDISLEPTFVTERFSFEDRLAFWKSLPTMKDEL